MKRKLFFFAAVALFVCNMTKANTSDEDSTKVFDSGNKRIIVTEIPEKQRVDVEVYERQEDGEYQPYEKIFEGHYRDGKSSEQRKYLMSIDIPSPFVNMEIKDGTWKFRTHGKHDRGHYAGFSIGYAGFIDKGDLGDIPFRTGRSPEINLNFFDQAIALTRNRKWNIVTGLGIRWTRYHLKGDNYFKEINDNTSIIKAPEDWRINKSRLGITTLNVPLLLELNVRKNGMFLSAGAVCSFKTASSSKIWYVDGRNKNKKEEMDSGMTLRPVTYDLLFQFGTNDFGLFTRYSPISIFERNKGPELYPLTVGLMLYFN